MIFATYVIKVNSYHLLYAIIRNKVCQYLIIVLYYMTFDLIRMDVNPIHK